MGHAAGGIGACGLPATPPHTGCHECRHDANRMMSALTRGIARLLTAGLLAAITSPAMADYFPMYSTWDQPGGPGSAVRLTYSYSNLLDGSLLNRTTGQSFRNELLRSAFETAL